MTLVFFRVITDLEGNQEGISEIKKKISKRTKSPLNVLSKRSVTLKHRYAQRISR